MEHKTKLVIMDIVTDIVEVPHGYEVLERFVLI